MNSDDVLGSRIAMTISAVRYSYKEIEHLLRMD